MDFIIQQLRRYRILKAEIKGIELDIEELHEADNIGPGAITYEEHTGPTNKFNSLTENEAINLAEKTTQLEREKRAKEREIERIDNALSVLGEKEKLVMELKYIRGFRWDNVTYTLDRSYAQCKAIEAEALKKLAPFFRR